MTHTHLYIYIYTNISSPGGSNHLRESGASRDVCPRQKKGWRKMENGIFMVENDGNMMGKCWENDGKMLGK